MENTPTLEEVKEYFKNALKVKDFNNDIGKVKIDKIKYSHQTYLQKPNKKNHLILWNEDYGYAQILTYKEKTFSITESHIKTLYDIFEVSEAYQGQDYLKEWFPEAFESKVKSLPKDFTGWVKDKRKGCENFMAYSENGIILYGFNVSGEWVGIDVVKISLSKNEYEATEQEVFEALKNEAVKRGFSSPCIYKPTESIRDAVRINGEERWGFIFEENKLLLNNYRVFNKGKWAEIIPTITLSEAEQQLKKKIIV